MPKMTLEEVEKAINSPSGTFLVKYNKFPNSFIIMNVFFKPSGQVGLQMLLEKVKSRLPDAEVMDTWVNEGDGQLNHGSECVKFRI